MRLLGVHVTSFKLIALLALDTERFLYAHTGTVEIEKWRCCYVHA